jgi:TolA-binding protein
LIWTWLAASSSAAGPTGINSPDRAALATERSAGAESAHGAHVSAPTRVPLAAPEHDAARTADELRALHGSVAELNQQLQHIAQDWPASSATPPTSGRPVWC